MRPTTAVIMAAGLSLRMGCNKLLLPFRSKPILQHCIDLVVKMGFAECLLVTTPQVLEEVAAPMQVLLNADPWTGQSASVRMGAAQAKEGNSLLFFPGDQPLMDRQIVELLLEADDGNSILYPLGEEGEPASPTLFAPRFRRALMEVQGDNGGKRVRQDYREHCRGIPVPQPWLLRDIDTREEYNWLCDIDNKA